MAFTTKEFPNKVFENMKEYYAYMGLRKKIIERMKSKQSETKTHVVKVKNVIHQNDPVIQLLLCILQSQKT